MILALLPRCMVLAKGTKKPGNGCLVAGISIFRLTRLGRLLGDWPLFPVGPHGDI